MPPDPDLAARVAELEARLAEREGRFAALIDALQVGVVVQGPASQILLFNAKALELLDMTEDQLAGRSSLDPTWNIIREDGTPFPGDERPVMVSIRSRKPVRDVAIGVYRHSSGERVWLLVSATPQLGPDGAVLQVVSTFTDVTSRRRIEDVARGQAQRILELSTPLIPIDGRTLVVPLLGGLDQARAQRLLATLTEGVVDRKAAVVILDLTGVPELDATGAMAIERSAGAVRLLGARFMLSGVRPTVASAIVEHDAHVGALEIHATLEHAIAASRTRRR
jgi:PAS domain S-box-containing protein